MKKTYTYVIEIKQIVNVDYLPEGAKLIYEPNLKIESNKLLSEEELLEIISETLEVYADTPDVWEGEFEVTFNFDLIEKESL